MKSWIDIIVKIDRSFYSLKRLIGNKGTYIMREDWDNLIILDACRYDMFEKLNDIKGTLEYRLSRGPCTSEFLRENFKGKKFNDTVYITANPLVNYHVPESFAKIVSVWKDRWYEKYGTVLPQDMVEYALKTNEMYPQKRLIIHFMQPHYPFIGERSREKIGVHDGILARDLVLGDEKVEHTAQSVWNLFKEGKLDKNTVWEAYEENLQIVLKYVIKLIENLLGKTVITSDHGNLFGERLFPLPIREYGHPPGIYSKNLIKVPWLVIENGERKKIKESKEYQNLDSVDDLEQSNIKEKLKALGYLLEGELIITKYFAKVGAELK